MLNYVRAASRFIYLFLLCTGLCFRLSAKVNNGPKVQIIRNPVIIIDPGHGGSDQGAKGRISVEKDINLATALRLKSLLAYHLPYAEVYLTREDDRYISLSERAQLANEKEADLFLSLHCNSNHTGDVRGAEVYIMGNHKSEDHLCVTLRENEDREHELINHSSISSLEEPDFIFINQIQSQILSRSFEYAEHCVLELNKNFPSGCRPLRQAGFVVLWQSAVPSALIEMGYINNLKDEEILNSANGQIMVAMSLVESIKSFFQNRQIETQNASIPLVRN